MIVALPLGAAAQNPAYRPSDPTLKQHMVNAIAAVGSHSATGFVAAIGLILTKNSEKQTKMSFGVIVSQFIPC